MWPQKSGLGVRLSYGIDGDGIVFTNSKGSNSDISQNAHLDFPRHEDDGPLLQEIQNSETTIMNSQKSSFNLNSSIYNELEENVSSSSKKLDNIPNMYIPKDILNSYMVESKTLTSLIAYDSTYGSLFKLFTIRKKFAISTAKYTERAAAFVSGESGSILSIALVNTVGMNIAETGEDESLGRVSSLKLGKTYEVSLSEPIKQIETAPILNGFISPFLIVRTNVKIYVLRCYLSAKKSKEKSNIELDPTGELPSTVLKGFDFADVTFNPWNSSAFSVVDVKGNFGLWKIEGKYISKVPSPPGSTESACSEVEELSNWKRISWSYDSKSLLLISRSSISSLDIEDAWSLQKLVTSNTWSRIIDFVKVDTHGFLLTSKELIWFRLDYSFHRVMSWKHFLDDSDPSMKLHVKEIESNEFVCLIYSQMHPLIFVYTFAWKDEKPFSMRDPYYIRRKDKSGGLQHIELVCLDLDYEKFIPRGTKFFGFFELTSTLNLSFSSFSTNGGLYSMDSPASTYEPLAAPMPTRQKRIILADFQIEELSNLYKNSYFSSPDDKLKSIQNYAFSLGQGAFKVSSSDQDSSPSYLSLLDISSQIPYSVPDVAEFDLMIEQLSGFYEQKDIILSSLINGAFMKNFKFKRTLDKDKAYKSVEELYIILKSIFLSSSSSFTLNSFESIQKASILMGFSLIKAKSTHITESLEQMYDKTFSEAPNNVQELLGDWSHEATEVSSTHGFSNTQSTFPDSYSTIPTIKLSQRSQSVKKSNKLGKSKLSQSQVHFSQNSFPPATPVQVESQAISDSAFSSQGFSQTQPFLRNSSQVVSQRMNSQKRNMSQLGSQSKQKKKKKGGFA